MKADFWNGRRVFVTGHTGFKGSWLCLWLQHLGARVVGYSLPPEAGDNLFEGAAVGAGMVDLRGDVRDLSRLSEAVRGHQPEIVFHLAAQSLVRESYRDPVGTYATNVMGTVHVLEALRTAPSVRAAVIVTSDKCYENRELDRGYREGEPLGGADPYSNSKACAELVVDAYRKSFFRDSGISVPAIASARAGNVIGGGDWARDRLVPDAMRAFAARQTLEIRYPRAVRPWQHVLDALGGYLLLAERLVDDREKFGCEWNFGPDVTSEKTVAEMADRLVSLWGDTAAWRHPGAVEPHEATYLRLDCTRAHRELGWTPIWGFDNALSATVEWYKGWAHGAEARVLTTAQIKRFSELASLATTPSPDAPNYRA